METWAFVSFAISILRRASVSYNPVDATKISQTFIMEAGAKQAASSQQQSSAKIHSVLSGL